MNRRHARDRRFAGGVHAFTPKSLGNLLLWVRSTSIVPVSGKVQTWSDESGNGNDLVQSTAANRPGYNATDAAYGGKPSVSFDAVNTAIASAAFSLGAFTVYLAARQTTAGHFFRRGGTAWYCFGSTGNTLNVTNGANTSSYNLSANWGVSATPRTITNIFDGTHAGHKLRINGVAQTLTDGLTADPTAAAINDIFALFAVDGATPSAAGTCAEVLVYGAAHTAATNAIVEAYLQKKYGY